MLYASTLSSTDATDTTTSNSSLVTIEWVRDAVTNVLNDSFDYKEVAKNAALGKFQKKKKKKKKKGNDDVAAAVAEEKPPEPAVDLDAIAEEAISSAVPFTGADAMVTPATKDEFGDYQCNAAMGLSKNVKMQPRYV